MLRHGEFSHTVREILYRGPLTIKDLEEELMSGGISVGTLNKWIYGTNILGVNYESGKYALTSRGEEIVTDVLKTRDFEPHSFKKGELRQHVLLLLFLAQQCLTVSQIAAFVGLYPSIDSMALRVDGKMGRKSTAKDRTRSVLMNLQPILQITGSGTQESPYLYRLREDLDFKDFLDYLPIEKKYFALILSGLRQFYTVGEIAHVCGFTSDYLWTVMKPECSDGYLSKTSILVELSHLLSEEVEYRSKLMKIYGNLKYDSNSQGSGYNPGDVVCVFDTAPDKFDMPSLVMIATYRTKLNRYGVEGYAGICLDNDERGKIVRLAQEY